MSQVNPSPQFRVLKQFYEAISVWKVEVIEELFSEEYKHATLPASANDPPKNKAQGIAHMRAIAKSFDNKPVKYEIFQWNESEGSIWVHSRLYGEIPGGIQFSNESIFIFTFSSGSDIKITAVQEFIDTKQAADAAAASSTHAQQQ